MRKFDRLLVPVAYGLLAIVAVLSYVAYAAGVMWPIYTAGVLFAAVLLVYILPASADAINRRHNIGGAVIALLLSLLIVPTVLAVGTAVGTASTALDGPTVELHEPADYSPATTVEECQEIWLEDFSQTADADRDDCTERVGD